MAKRFVVEDVRATGWSLRLRDSVTGETIDVPVTPGTKFSPPGGARGDDERGRRERRADEAAPVKAPRTESAPGSDQGSPASSQDKAKKDASRKRRARKPPSQNGKDSGPWGAGKPNPLETQQGRITPIDEKTLTDDDRKVLVDHQAFWAHVLGAKGSKRGGLGWEETTDAGRSGLRARYKSGTFKILHAGGDTYALFYEWDSGKFEKIACGKADELMTLAQQRTQEKLPPPPRTLLDLEMARHMCATDPEQRRIAADRLAPIFRELEAQEEERRKIEADLPPTRRRRSQGPAVPPPAAPSPAQEPPATPPAADAGIDAQRDAALMASFSQALAEMEEE